MTLKMADYWMGRDRQYPELCTEQIRTNALQTVTRANMLLQAYSAMTKDYADRRVNSGWRPPSINAATPGAAPKSKHMSAQAIDIADPEGDLDEWCLTHGDQLVDIGLWLEHPASTKGWCHVQIVAPRSGNRIFYP